MEDVGNRVEFVVVGAGIAGIRAAISLAPHGRVVLLTKSRADESNTEYAQGGIAAAISDEDEIGLHYEDTLLAGDGLCEEAAVQVLVAEGPDRILELIEWGTQFDREGVKLAFTQEAAHRRRRILHAGGDSTGKEIIRTLIQKARSLPNIRLISHAFAREILIDKNRCLGVQYLDERTGSLKEVQAESVLLATGGLGVLYPETTNPNIATGDGCALAFRAGALLADMEFVQFHPTVLKLEGAPHFLLSEAMRGEGGRLVNRSGEPFMSHYHPDADLAPRDVVCRSIVSECVKTGSDRVLLDLTHLDPELLKKRFPHILETCRSFGLDLSQKPAPVYPAAHYMMGGVLTDLWGRTTIPGLFAAGEVACAGVHGANRLASNSLLEGLVYGARVAKAMVEEAVPLKAAVRPLTQEPWQTLTEDCSPEDSLQALQTVAHNYIGVVRSSTGLLSARERLEQIPVPSRKPKAACEVENLLMNARLIASSALLRHESRGGHYREDFPEKDDLLWHCHTTAAYDSQARVALFGQLPLGFSHPSETPANPPEQVGLTSR